MRHSAGFQVCWPDGVVTVGSERGRDGREGGRTPPRPPASSCLLRRRGLERDMLCSVNAHARNRTAANDRCMTPTLHAISTSAHLFTYVPYPPIPFSVKRDVVSDTMRVVNVRPGGYRRHQEQEAARSKRRLYGTSGGSEGGGDGIGNNRSGVSCTRAVCVHERGAYTTGLLYCWIVENRLAEIRLERDKPPATRFEDPLWRTQRRQGPPKLRSPFLSWPLPQSASGFSMFTLGRANDCHAPPAGRTHGPRR